MGRGAAGAGTCQAMSLDERAAVVAMRGAMRGAKGIARRATDRSARGVRRTLRRPWLRRLERRPLAPRPWTLAGCHYMLSLQPKR